MKKEIKKGSIKTKVINLSLQELLGGPNFTEVHRFNLTDKQVKEFEDNKKAFETQAKIMDKLEKKRLSIFQKWEKKAEKAGIKFEKCTYEAKEKVITFSKAEFTGPLGKALAEVQE